MSWAQALDFNPDTGSLCYGVGLFYAHTDGLHAPVFQAFGGDGFGQGFNQMNMAFGGYLFRISGCSFIADDVRDFTAKVCAQVLNAHVYIDEYALCLNFLMGVNTQCGYNFQITDKDMPDAAYSICQLIGA